MILLYFSSLAIASWKNIWIYSTYSLVTFTGTTSTSSEAIWALQDKYIASWIFGETIYTIKAFFFRFRAMATKFLQSINSIRFLVGRVLAIIKLFHSSSLWIYVTLALYSKKKNILSIIFKLILANKEIFSKHQSFLYMS